MTDVLKSKYCRIIFDETTDLANIAQMSIVLRYLDKNLNIREDFVDDFTKEPILTGQILGETVINYSQKMGLAFENCVGIGTDTCSVMVSDQKGACKDP